MGRIKRIDHIAIAVKNLDESIDKFVNILGAEYVGKRVAKLAGSEMRVACLKLGDVIIGLDEANDPDGFIAKFIEKKGEGVHHLGLEVDNLDEYKRELKQKGVRIPHEEKVGETRKEILLSPKDLCGVVMQVIEWRGEDVSSLDERLDRLVRTWEEN